MLSYGLFAIIRTFVTFLALGCAHWFLWRYIAKPCWRGRPPMWLGWLATVSMSSGVLLPLLRWPWVGRHVVWYRAMVFAWWIGLMFTSLCGVVALGLAHVWTNCNLPQPLDPQRRLLLFRLMGLSVGSGGLGLSAVAWHRAHQGFLLKEVAIYNPRIPTHLDGLKIVQISDLHICELINAHYVEQVVSTCLALKPDLIVLTGDIIDAPSALALPVAALLQHLRARLGVYMVTGNHEYYHDALTWLDYFAQWHIQVLRNESIALRDAAGEILLQLVGIDDLAGHAFGSGHGPNLRQAMHHCLPQPFTLLLAHQPRMMFQAAGYPIDLMLSGHTHGGQIWPFGYLVRLSQPYLQGLHTYKHLSVYVSAGTGVVGVPMRLGSFNELTQITLRALK